jgi:hypothetical protein
MSDTLEDQAIPLDTFGARLAIIRQYMGGWNVTRAAEACGIDHQSWRTWESGQRRPRDYPVTCQTISERLGIDYIWLMVGGPLRRPPSTKWLMASPASASSAAAA